MKSIDLSNVQEAGEFKRPTAGAYICEIKSAEDNADKEYLKITYDIADGEYTGYYSDLRANNPEWTNVGVYYRSYKPTALGMFKRMCSAVNKSNAGFTFDGKTNADEKTLAGKKIGLVFQEEEYYGNDGNKKTRLIVNREFPIDEIASQKIPAIKKLKEEDASDPLDSIPAGSDMVVPW